MHTISDLHPSEHPLLPKSIVLIGMPGSGKSTIGRKIASHLGLPFVDSDHEVETAANMSISQIFEKLGEPAFRDGERKVIARLLSGPPIILSTGGGAFMNDQTRQLIQKQALSIWLQATLDTLVERTSRTDDRPLLQNGNPKTILSNLMSVREPIYSQADLTVVSQNVSVETTAQHVLAAIKNIIPNTNGSLNSP
ncbi:MAG: shikimate kinase [Alphaproteobacteria bacterium]|nr:shikimate kinase [Alphaproteobacteria bacterium]